jgi:hypothetical protein
MIRTTENVIVVVLVDVPTNVAVTTASPLSVAEVAVTTFPVIEIKVLVVVNVVRKSVETSVSVSSYSLANKLIVAALGMLMGATAAGSDALAMRVKSVLMISSGPAVGDRVLTGVGDEVGEEVVGKEVVGEAVVGDTVVGDAVVGEAVVGNTVVGEAVVTVREVVVTVEEVGEEVVGETVGGMVGGTVGLLVGALIVGEAVVTVGEKVAPSKVGVRVVGEEVGEEVVGESVGGMVGGTVGLLVGALVVGEAVVSVGALVVGEAVVTVGDMVGALVVRSVHQAKAPKHPHSSQPSRRAERRTAPLDVSYPILLRLERALGVLTMSAPRVGSASSGRPQGRRRARVLEGAAPLPRERP